MGRTGKTSEAQDEVIAFLSRAESHGDGDEPVERIDTHISVVFLVGDRVYKMKRAVVFDYVDYGTPDQRRRFCEAELKVNGRTAPELYLRVVPVTREADGTLKFDGDGQPVEWLVEMRRFDQDLLFDRLATAGRLTPALLDELADSIARFHAEAEVDKEKSGPSAMRWVAKGNAHEIDGLTPSVFAQARAEALKSSTDEALAATAKLLDTRAVQGRLRRCHGDLHLRNICLYDGRPTLFDGIEFNDAISVVDVLYDLAFLLMDLVHRGHREYPNRVFNRYFAMASELDGLAALPLFLSCRAAVRAHTTAAAAVMTDSKSAAALEAEARDYLDLACEFLEPAAPSLLAIGGLSGTGKSTLAQCLAPERGRAPGALLLRSDVVRKRMHGVAPEVPLDPSAYTAAQSARVYERLQRDAAAALAAGHSVVVDAVFGRADERKAIEAVAARAGAPAQCLWLDAPAKTLQARVDARTGDASDADSAVVRRQLAIDTGNNSWRRVDAGGGFERTLAAARMALDG